MPRSIPRTFLATRTVVAAFILAVMGVGSAVRATAGGRTSNRESAPFALRGGPAQTILATRRVPVYGGDAVPGEIDDSYAARTGRHVPFRPSQPSVESNGSIAAWGGDRASNESDVSYGARTGRITVRSPLEVVTLCPIRWFCNGPFGW
jgi:hypothetical protein